MTDYIFYDCTKGMREGRANFCGRRKEGCKAKTYPELIVLFHKRRRNAGRNVVFILQEVYTSAKRELLFFVFK